MNNNKYGTRHLYSTELHHTFYILIYTLYNPIWYYLSESQGGGTPTNCHTGVCRSKGSILRGKFP